MKGSSCLLPFLGKSFTSIEPLHNMGLLNRIEEKFHNDKHNTNRMMSTINNQQKFGFYTGDSPRNRMMDTISNEQGASLVGNRKVPNLEYSSTVVNRNLMTHTISNEQAEDLACGIDIRKDRSAPRNKLLDLRPNESFGRSQPKLFAGLNSDRVL